MPLLLSEGLKPVRSLDYRTTLATRWGLSSSMLPDLSEFISTSGEQGETLPTSQAYEVMCVGMFYKLKRDGQSYGIVPVCSVCVYGYPDSDLPS